MPLIEIADLSKQSVAANGAETLALSDIPLPSSTPPT